MKFIFLRNILIILCLFIIIVEDFPKKIQEGATYRHVNLGRYLGGNKVK